MIEIVHVTIIASLECCAIMVFSADESFNQTFVPVKWQIGTNF